MSETLYMRISTQNIVRHQVLRIRSCHTQRHQDLRTCPYQSGTPRPQDLSLSERDIKTSGPVPIRERHQDLRICPYQRETSRPQDPSLSGHQDLRICPYQRETSRPQDLSLSEWNTKTSGPVPIRERHQDFRTCPYQRETSRPQDLSLSERDTKT